MDESFNTRMIIGKAVRNESTYKRYAMGLCASGVKCGVVEWVKRNTLRLFCHIERMKSEEFVKKKCM